VKNPLLIGCEEWVAAVYSGKAMPPVQQRQLECAFIAGAVFGCKVRAKHGDEVVLQAVQEHMQRMRRDLPQCPEEDAV